MKRPLENDVLLAVIAARENAAQQTLILLVEIRFAFVVIVNVRMVADEFSKDAGS